MLVALLTILPSAVFGSQAGSRALREAERLEREGDLTAALGILDAPPSAERSDEEELTAAALRWLLLHRLRRFGEAETAGRDWIATSQRRSAAADGVEALWSTGRSVAAQGRRVEASQLLEQALRQAASADSAEGAAATEVALRARVAIDLATLLLDLGGLRRAAELLDDVSRLVDRRADDGLELRYLTALGTLYHYRGESEEAIRIWAEAAALAQRTGGDAARARYLYRMSQARIALHDYAEAVTLLHRILALEPSPDRARSLISLGICHYELNQLDEAESVLQEALQALAESADRSQQTATEAWAWGELGLVAFERGDAELALERFARATKLSARAGDDLNEIGWRANSAMVLREEGRFEQALVLYRQAAALQRQVGGERSQAAIDKGMGQSYAGLGQDGRAEERFRAALEGAASHGDSKILWQTERELARLYRRTQRPEEAAAAYGRALDALEDVRGSLRLEAFKRDFFRDKVEVYGEAIGLLVSEERFESGAEQALAISERARGRAFLDSLAEGRARLHETLPRTVRERERGILDEVSELQARLRAGDASDDAASRVKGLERELEALQLEVRRTYPRFRELRSTEVAPLEEIQSVVGEDEAVLSYFLDAGRSHLWVISRLGLEHYELSPAVEIETAVRHALPRLLDHEAGGEEDAFQNLADLLLGPWLSGRVEVPGAWVIVPSGILHFFPFEVLPVGGVPLASLARTSYVPSATTLVELRLRPTVVGPPALLAVGDPPLGRHLPSKRPDAVGLERSGEEHRLAQLESLGALPHTREEVEAVASYFGRRRSTLMLDRAATEANFKAVERPASVIHLATHGWIDPSSAAASALVLGAGDGEDGLLQFREILRLHLAADLVTLSACQSALGELVTGEGLIGLTRAFFYAGTDSVVASLWNVDDEASAFFMGRFYGALHRGLPKAEALRQARLATRRQPRYRSPYFWAPWVLLGQGEDRVAFPPRAGSLVPAALVATAVLLALAGLAAWRRWR